MAKKFEFKERWVKEMNNGPYNILFSFRNKEVFVDISTRYIKDSDCRALEEFQVPGQISVYDEGAFLLLDPDMKNHILRDIMTNATMSEAFIELLIQAKKQGIYLINFDADGGDVHGAPEF